MSLRCVAVDDEPVALEIVTDYIRRTRGLKLAGSFRRAREAMAFLRRHETDLLFLDINMPDVSGLDLLGSMSRRPLVVFTTAYSQYAAESYDYEAVDYLLKPIEYERFLEAVGRVRKRVKLEEGDGGILILKSGRELYRIRRDDILYIQSMGNYSLYVTRLKEIMVLVSLDRAVRDAGEGVVRVHKSYAVAVNHVDRVQPRQVLIGRHVIPLGDTYRDQFLRRFNAGLRGKEK